MPMTVRLRQCSDRPDMQMVAAAADDVDLADNPLADELPLGGGQDRADEFVTEDAGKAHVPLGDLQIGRADARAADLDQGVTGFRDGVGVPRFEAEGFVEDEGAHGRSLRLCGELCEVVIGPGEARGIADCGFRRADWGKKVRERGGGFRVTHLSKKTYHAFRGRPGSKKWIQTGYLVDTDRTQSGYKPDPNRNKVDTEVDPFWNMVLGVWSGFVKCLASVVPMWHLYDLDGRSLMIIRRRKSFLGGFDVVEEGRLSHDGELLWHVNERGWREVTEAELEAVQPVDPQTRIVACRGYNFFLITTAQAGKKG